MTTPMIPLSDVEMVFGQIGAMMVEALQTLRDSDGCVSGKSNEKSKKKSPRMCPVKKAKDLNVDDAMTGRDGFVWVVAVRPKSGAHYWKKCFLEDYENCIDNINFIEQEDAEVECYEFDEAVEKSEAPKKRGRPKKVEEAPKEALKEAPKKRGRPKKVEAQSKAVKEAPKKRGRPKKVKAVEEAPKEKSEAPKEKSEAPKRGRPKKVKESQSKAPEKSETPKEKKAPVPRKCPVQKAKDAGMGASAVGNDGNTWIVAERPNSGFLYWKKSK